MNEFEHLRTHRVLRPKAVCAKIGLKNAMFCEIQRPGSQYFDATFPKGFFLTRGGRAKGYFEEEIDKWIASRAAMRPARAGV